MVNMIRLTLLAIATATVSAVDIRFIRYAEQGCIDEHHIDKDTHLHDPHCKTFDSDEPLFESFMITTEDDAGDLYNKFCTATVFSEANCMGKSSNQTRDMRNYINKCVNPHLDGRSVLISCQDRDTTTTVTVASASAYTPETTTLMLMPHADTFLHDDYGLPHDYYDLPSDDAYLRDDYGTEGTGCHCDKK